jgi:hypothetical protein
LYARLGSFLSDALENLPVCLLSAGERDEIDAEFIFG